MSHYDHFDLGQDSAYCDRISDPPEDENICPECECDPCRCEIGRDDDEPLSEQEQP